MHQHQDSPEFLAWAEAEQNASAAEGPLMAKLRDPYGKVTPEEKEHVVQLRLAAQAALQALLESFGAQAPAQAYRNLHAGGLPH